MDEVINSLPTKTDKEKSIKADFKQRYETKLDKIYNITRLTDADYILELPNSANYLLADDGNVFAISDEAQAIFKIKADEKNQETITSDSLPSPILSAVVDDPLEYYISQNNVTSYKAETGQFSTFAIDNPPAQIESATVYNNRLYIISAGNIYRSEIDRKTNTFSNSQAWIKDGTTLSQVKSMAIDGRIYVLENNTVSKFSGGKKEVLSLDEISPKLEEPKAVYVSFDNDFLYILEAKNKRLLVYTKNGKYLAQYSGEMLDNLIGAAVDQKNGLVYFLNGKKIYRIKATHFQK